MSDVSIPIRASIDAFVQEIASLTRQAALEAVQLALGGAAPRTVTMRAARRYAPASTPKRALRARGGKRTPDQVGHDAERILAFVKANEGCGAEQIRDGLGLSKKDIALPLLRLREEKRLKIAGQKRGTKYFAGGSSSRASASAKRVAPKAKRRKLSGDQRAALLARLAKARAARSAKLAARR